MPDRERIDEVKRQLRLNHGYNRRADNGKVIQSDEPKTLAEKLARLERRTEAGEQALRTAPVSNPTHKMRHARRSK